MNGVNGITNERSVEYSRGGQRDEQLGKLATGRKDIPRRAKAKACKWSVGRARKRTVHEPLDYYCTTSFLF
jgi:hypothetical protein